MVVESVTAHQSATLTVPPAGPLGAPGAILLVACYELGHQPLTLAAPLAHLRAAGYAPRSACAVV